MGRNRKMNRPNRYEPNVWEMWNHFPPPPRLPFGLPPVPLMSMPPPFRVPAPQFRTENSFNSFEYGSMDYGLDPELARSYEILNSPFFVRQCPPSCLPNLRLPRRHGGPIFDPYDTSPFVAVFAPLFDAMLHENFTFHSKHINKDVANVISDFRSLPLNEQLDQFVYARTLSAEQVRIRWQIVLDILFVLRQEYPMSEVYAFGSLLSGFSDRTSDVDIFVDLLGPNPATTLSQSVALHHTKRVLKNVQCPHTGRSFLNGRIIEIPRARVPILTIEHGPTSVSFDLSFGNLLSTQNSKLVVLYANMDPRVFRFMVLIRYWLKFHNLSGSNDVKNYALTLLGLVYLVQKGIVPSIHLLQMLKKEQREKQGVAENPDEIEGWDASFCEELDLIFQHFQPTCPVSPDFHENPCEHLLVMLQEFCKLYAHMDFGAVVVCPLLGEVLLKGGFLPGNEVYLTEMLHRYKSFSQKCSYTSRLKLMTPLCIQDPFVLNFNVTAGTPLGSLIKFQIACAKTAETLASKLEAKDGTLSLLDAFISLPNHLNSKDLVKTYRSAVRKRRFLREIGNALGIGVLDKNAEGEKMEEQENQELPNHLKSLYGLMDRDSYESWLFEQSSYEIVECSLQPNFTSLFFNNVERYGMMKCGSNDSKTELVRRLAQKMVSLWSQFAMDFIWKFFEEALKLKVVGTMREATTRTEGLAVEELYGLVARPNWKLDTPVKPYKGQRTEELNDRFREKIEGICTVSAEKETYFRMITVQVPHAFWNSRPVRLKEWGAHEKKTVSKHGHTEYKENPLQVEGLISEYILKNNKTGGNGKGGERPSGGDLRKNDSATGKENKEANAGKIDSNVETIVQTENHEKSKRIRLDSGSNSIDPVVLDVLIKMTFKVGDEGTHDSLAEVTNSWKRPVVSLVVQNNTSKRNYRMGISKLTALFVTMFPEYQLYRLHEWLAESGRAG